jgi:hypothetical protein
MALLTVESCDQFDIEGPMITKNGWWNCSWSTPSGGDEFSRCAGRPLSFNVNRFLQYRDHVIETAEHVIIGWRWDAHVAAGTHPFVRWYTYNDSVQHAYISAEGAIGGDITNGRFHIYNGDGTLLASSAERTQVPGYYEARYKYGTTDGEIELRIDGVTVLAVTGVDTTNSAVTVGEVIFGGFDGVNRGLADDIYLLTVDGGAFGDFLCTTDALLGVSYAAPAATGSHAGFTAVGAASTADAIDETPVGGLSNLSPSTADYASATSDGLVDTFPLTFSKIDTGGNPTLTRILTVQWAVYALGNGSGIRPVVRSGGVDYTYATHTLTASYGYKTAFIDTDPATGLAWTQESLAAAEFGYQVDGYAAEVRVAQFGIEALGDRFCTGWNVGFVAMN